MDGYVKHVPMSRFRPHMDQGRAKVILGMDPAQNLDDVTIQTIHAVFTAKLQEEATLELAKGKRSNHDIHEAYQFLTQKKKKRGSRSMTQNWAAVGGKAAGMGAGLGGGGLLAKLKAGAAAEAQGEANPGLVVLRQGAGLAVPRKETALTDAETVLQEAARAEQPNWAAWQESELRE